MRKIKLSLILLLLFLAYRLYFWEDVAVHGKQAFFNALFDAFWAICCGMVLYKLLKGKSIKRWMLALSGFTVVCFSLLLFASHTLVYYFVGILDTDFKPMFFAVCFQLLDSVAIIITGSMLYILQEFFHEKKNLQSRMQEVETAKDKLELKYLKSKIDPHFIFNGLNCIFHEINAENTSARNQVLQFADIVRYHLQHAAHEQVEIAVEMDYLKSYIAFQHNRLSDFINLKQEIHVKDQKTMIEPLLILPFVENAFKYCSQTGEEKGNIDLQIHLDDSHLCVDIVNTYCPQHRDNQEKNGFGIENIYKRLKRLYPDRFKLILEDIKEKRIFKCHFEIAI